MGRVRPENRIRPSLRYIGQQCRNESAKSRKMQTMSLTVAKTVSDRVISSVRVEQGIIILRSLVQIQYHPLNLHINYINFLVFTQKSNRIMSTTKAVLLALNSSLFAFRQPSVLHDIYVVGVKVPDPNDNTKKIVQYVQKSKPNAAAIEAGIKSSDFIHTSFKPTGSIKIDEASGEEAFSGPKKSQVGVTFQSAQPDLFNFIKKAIEAGEGAGYVMNGEVQMTDPKTGKTFKRPQILLKKKIFGKIIAMNVPEYTPHNVGADGKFHALAPISLDPVTGKYIKKEVTMGSIKFFADDDDLDLLEEAAARIVDKRVRPFVKDKKTLVVEDAFGNKRVEVKEPVNTGANPENEEEAAENLANGDDDDEKN